MCASVGEGGEKLSMCPRKSFNALLKDNLLVSQVSTPSLIVRERNVYFDRIVTSISRTMKDSLSKVFNTGKRLVSNYDIL